MCWWVVKPCHWCKHCALKQGWSLNVALMRAGILVLLHALIQSPSHMSSAALFGTVTASSSFALSNMPSNIACKEGQTCWATICNGYRMPHAFSCASRIHCLLAGMHTVESVWCNAGRSSKSLQAQKQVPCAQSTHEQNNLTNPARLSLQSCKR